VYTVAANMSVTRLAYWNILLTLYFYSVFMYFPYLLSKLLVRCILRGRIGVPYLICVVRILSDNSFSSDVCVVAAVLRVVTSLFYTF
jgi:hypothetical protein